MSRRTFEALSAHMVKARPPSTDVPAYKQWAHDVYMIAMALSSVNHAFNPQRFCQDCQRLK